ncbi:MAG: PAS domain-containing protein, partial [Pseudomonadota bacterium]
MEAFNIAQGSLLGITVLSADGTVLAINNLLLAMLSREPEDIVGQSATALGASAVNSDQTIANDQSLWNDLGKNKVCYRLREVWTGDGMIKFFANRYFPILNKNEELTKVVILSTDVTKDYDEQATVRARATSIDATQAVIEFQIDGTIIDANANFCAVMGYTKSEIVGKHHAMFVGDDIMPPEDYKLFWADLRAGVVKTGEFARRAKDGSLRHIQASYSRVT